MTFLLNLYDTLQLTKSLLASLLLVAVSSKKIHHGNSNSLRQSGKVLDDPTVPADVEPAAVESETAEEHAAGGVDLGYMDWANLPAVIADAKADCTSCNVCDAGKTCQEFAPYDCTDIQGAVGDILSKAATTQEQLVAAMNSIVAGLPAGATATVLNPGAKSPRSTVEKLMGVYKVHTARYLYLIPILFLSPSP
jgi:hypothetical protein